MPCLIIIGIIIILLLVLAIVAVVGGIIALLSGVILTVLGVAACIGLAYVLGCLVEWLIDNAVLPAWRYFYRQTLDLIGEQKRKSAARKAAREETAREQAGAPRRPYHWKDPETEHEEKTVK